MAVAFTGTTVLLQSFIFYKSFSVPTFAACIRRAHCESGRISHRDWGAKELLLPCLYRRMKKASRLIFDVGAKSGPA